MARNWRNGAASASRPSICRWCARFPRSPICCGACATRLQIAIASSAKKDELEKYLEIAGIADLVDVTTSSDDAEESKPAPDIFETVLKKLGIEGHDAVAIGDTPYDAEAAGKARSRRSACSAAASPRTRCGRPDASRCIRGRPPSLLASGTRSSQDRPMARKLKTYQTSLGFFDQAIAAPSMKAALEAWGADSNLFHQGAAKESDDPDVIAATMAKPGVVLKRPVGSNGPFREHAELPTSLGDGGKPTKAARKPEGRKPKKASPPVDKAAERKAALAYERERKRRERERAREEAARQKERERRQQAIDKAQAALDKAEREHGRRVDALRAEIEAIEKKLKFRGCRMGSGRAAAEGCDAARARVGSGSHEKLPAFRGYLPGCSVQATELTVSPETFPLSEGCARCVWFGKV